MHLTNIETGPTSLHEGIADILGTYIESVFQNNTPDWIIADDMATSEFLRDLENPEETCFTEVSDLGPEDDYLRAAPITHWFYLVSEGNASLGFPVLELETSVLILLDALANMNYEKGDYTDLMEETLRIIEENHGRCSDEFIAFASAWNEICVNTGFSNTFLSNCTYSLDGSRIPCEEDDRYTTCVVGGALNYYYHWTILGKKNTEFDIWGNQIGNSWTGGRCLKILDFPKYPYYPQVITIQVRNPVMNLDLRMDVILRDCDGQDPSCEAYHSDDHLMVINPEYSHDQKQETTFDKDNLGLQYNNSIHYVEIYNLVGQLIYSGTYSKYNVNFKQEPEILIYIYYDKNYNIIETKKLMHFR